MKHTLLAAPDPVRFGMLPEVHAVIRISHTGEYISAPPGLHPPPIANCVHTGLCCMTQCEMIEVDVGQVWKREYDEVQKRKQNESPGRTAAAGNESNDARTARGTAVRDEAIGKIERNKSGKIKRAAYEAELARLQIELVKLQEYVKEERLRVVVVFEGRDARRARAARSNASRRR